MNFGIYLPVAGNSVNVLLLVGLGGTVGLLSGLFGVGGGFLITPLLFFVGVPPAVAVATGRAPYGTAATWSPGRRRTRAATAVTPSSRALWRARSVPALAKLLNSDNAHLRDLARRAEQFREHFIARLLDAEHQWFRCLDKNRQPRIAYSIQIFDLLRTGMLTREQQEAKAQEGADRQQR